MMNPNPKYFFIILALLISVAYGVEEAEQPPAYRLTMPEESYDYFKEEVFQGAKRIDWFDFETGAKFQLNKTAV